MSERRRILVSWVGHTDLNGFASGQTSDAELVREALRDRFKADEPPMGPIKAAAEAREFDEVHLIGDYPPDLLKRFGRWIGRHVRTKRVEIANPTDYSAVYTAAEHLLSEVARQDKNGPPELWISLSSGTPAMAATLILLGKTRFPARFMQSYNGKASEAEIPFDLTLEYLPELLREPDAAIQALSDKNPADVEGFDAIIGNSPAIKLAVGRAKRTAIRDVSVLILGESGVGKELFAQAIHAASRRREGPFVPINCAAIPRELQESELFGHVKGGFTGATKDRKGAFHQANGGTLFLDEFGELDIRTQAALLRALQPGPNESACHRTFRRVGAEKDDSADVRIIAATNRNPLDQMNAGALREDLFYRVSTITLRLPALRDRRSDIPALAEALLGRINRQFEKEEPGYEHKSLSGAAKGFVSRYDWPGNVRELSNVLVQAAVMTAGKTIGKSDIEAALAESPSPKATQDALERPLGGGFDLQKHLDDIERHFLERGRDEAGGVKTKAADLLGLSSYQTLDGKLKRLGIKWKRSK